MQACADAMAEELRRVNGTAIARVVEPVLSPS
jgi:hypothetical protein